MTTSEHTPTEPTAPVVAGSAAAVTDLFVRALEGDDLADAELGRRWFDEDDRLAGRAVHALTDLDSAEADRDPQVRAWLGTPAMVASGDRLAAWVRDTAAGSTRHPVPDC